MYKFNRILLASGLAATASLVANSPAFAGTTGKIDLSGTVPAALSMTVNSIGAGSLDLSPGNHQDVKIGTITDASTNSPSGLKVTVSSSWKVVSGSNSIYIYDFADAQHADAPTPGSRIGRQPSEGESIVVNFTNTNEAGSAYGSSYWISYNVPDGQAAGTYTGSITFTASDK